MQKRANRNEAFLQNLTALENEQSMKKCTAANRQLSDGGLHDCLLHFVSLSLSQAAALCGGATLWWELPSLLQPKNGSQGIVLPGK